MLTRRTMIRALSFGAPAAAVAAVLPAAPAQPMATELTALSVNFGAVIAGEIKARGPVAREMERAYSLRRSLA